MYIRKKGHIDKSIQRPFTGKYGLVDLSKMMTYPRPAGSKMEEKFIHKYIDTVPGMKTDMFGNRFITVGKKPTTLFASHTDTVHKDVAKSRKVYKHIQDKHDPGSYRSVCVGKTKPKPQEHQKVFIKGKWAYKRDDDVLGADDTTGNWLMLNLIHEKKPGVYVFHREEEIGGWGGKFFVKHQKPMLRDIKRVVSFDRMGYGDVITHQARGRTASDEFAKTLAGKLGGGFAPSTGGSFTDSASYADIVPECTNVSVGFKHAHTQAERQNLRFARHLYGKVRDIDFEKLPTERDPSVKDDNDYWYGDWKYSDYTPRKKGVVITPSIYDDEYFDNEDKINRDIQSIAKKGRKEPQKGALSKWDQCDECGGLLLGSLYYAYCNDPKCSKFGKVFNANSKSRINRINKQLKKTQEEKKHRNFEESHDEWIRRITPYQSSTSSTTSVDVPRCRECGVTLREANAGYYCGNPGCSRYHERYIPEREKKPKVMSVPFDDSTCYDDFVYEDMRRKKREGIIE